MLIHFFLSAALAAEPGPLETLLVQELDRAVAVYSEQDQPTHYVALTVEDRDSFSLAARAGTLSHDKSDHERYLDVDLRVGTPELDSTHALRGFSGLEADTRWRNPAPQEEGPALRHALWRELDRSYREGAERIVMIRANRNVLVEEEDSAPDFVPREPTVDRREVPELHIDEEAWTAALVDLSTHLDASPVVHSSSAILRGERVVKTFVDTEGTRLVHGSTHLRVQITAGTTAPDGDDIALTESIDVHLPSHLPPAEQLTALADQTVQRLEALSEAPRGTPYSGPVLLSGQAAAVFFHEIFGHRVEGHRQKSEDEGKTFAEHVGRPVLPEHIDVFDDPTLSTYEAGSGQVDLNGHYVYDDEGVPAQRAVLVEDGVFTGFLMGRTPIEGFEQSNGHGRRMAGNAPVSRMGNTIIESSQAMPWTELVEALRREVRRQDLEYGYIVDDIEGGFTQTGRVTPNAFNVRAVTTWRVYADGRPDELVRGIDLVGTPLVAFGTLVGAGDTPEVFNGSCGAESGWVPVSAVAPPLLFQKLEFQLKEKGQDRPPLLPKPGVADAEVGS